MIVVSVILVCCYRDKIIQCEIRKEIIMNLALDYTTFLDELNSNAYHYVYTEDEYYKNKYLALLSPSTKERKLSNYEYTLSPKQINWYVSHTDKLSGSSEKITLDEKMKFLKFNNEEQQLYEQFLNSHLEVISYYSKAIEQKDLTILNSLEYNNASMEQNKDLFELVEQYLKRYNEYEDSVLTIYGLISIILIVLSIIYLFLIITHIILLTKKNHRNYYFNRLYNTVVENVNAGIAIKDENGRYEYANSKYKQIVEKKRAQIIGKTREEVFGDNLKETKNLENHHPVYDSGTAILSLNEEGKEKNLVYERLILTDEKGRPKKISFVQDITETQEMQAQLKAQLQEIKYYSSNKDSFIANISHELRTPLHAVVGMTSFLKETTLTEEQKGYIKNIEISTNLLLAVINDILDLSKMRNGSMGYYPTNFKLKEVLVTVESMFVERIKEKGLTWYAQYDFDPDLKINVDKTRLLQILVNLINNAYKFTINGSICLSISTVFKNPKNIELQFCVSDTGIGIAEGDLKKLFTEFEQLDNDLTKNHQGTGLGLPICKRIVEQFGGVMWVDSKFCQGSNFYFTIVVPISKPTEKVKDRQSQRVSLKDRKKQFPKIKARALLAEDMEINSEIAIRLLNNIGVECDLVTDGLEAVEACKKNPKDYYDIILLDIQMPNMDGYTASSKIRKTLEIDVPIIALTATVTDGITRAKYEGIIDSFLLKPFTVDEFYNAIYKRLSKKRGNNFKELKMKKERALAIKRLGGMESLYEKHLAKFKSQYLEAPAILMDFITSGQYEEAHRYAHSIKGLAGTLGLIDIQEKAAELESTIKNREANKIAAGLQAFKPVIEQVCKE